LAAFTSEQRWRTDSRPRGLILPTHDIMLW